MFMHKQQLFLLQDHTDLDVAVNIPFFAFATDDDLCLHTDTNALLFLLREPGIHDSTITRHPYPLLHELMHSCIRYSSFLL